MTGLTTFHICTERGYSTFVTVAVRVPPKIQNQTQNCPNAPSSAALLGLNLPFASSQCALQSTAIKSFKARHNGESEKTKYMQERR